MHQGWRHSVTLSNGFTEYVYYLRRKLIIRKVKNKAILFLSLPTPETIFDSQHSSEAEGLKASRAKQ